MIILAIYLTGLIVCLLYDWSLYNAGENPHPTFKPYQKILDELFWPVTLIMAFFLSFILKSIMEKKGGK